MMTLWNPLFSMHKLQGVKLICYLTELDRFPVQVCRYV